VIAARLSRWGGVAYIAVTVACADPSADTSDRVIDYLRADTYSRLVIELDAVEGLNLSPDVADPLLLALEGLVDKPGGVEFVFDDRWESADGQRHWSFEDLERRAESSFDLDVQADEVAASSIAPQRDSAVLAR